MVGEGQAQVLSEAGGTTLLVSPEARTSVDLEDVQQPQIGGFATPRYGDVNRLGRAESGLPR